MPSGAELEHLLLLCTAAVYLCANLTWLHALVVRVLPPRLYLPLITLGMILHSLVIAVRWVRLGHGPFITLYEILLSNTWSLTLITGIAYWWLRGIRSTFLISAVLLQLLIVWAMLAPAGDSHLPPTYQTPWLFFHVLAGKLFLGALLVAVNLSIAVLLRERGWVKRFIDRIPGALELDQMAYRFTAVALVFDSLMLLFGAIWAQDAWGRYWSWDPLETWSFITWLAVVFALHLRSYGGRRVREGVAAAVVVAFVVAFFTFFGMPFMSDAPHQGVV